MLFWEKIGDETTFKKQGEQPVNEEEYNKKYLTLRILKSIQDYLKEESACATAVYPIKVPEDLVYQVLKLQGPEGTDKLIGHIFKLGLDLWSEKIFSDVFRSSEKLEEFVALVKERARNENF